MLVIIPNSTFEDDTPPDIPMREDKTPYRFEMLFNGYTDRAYADTADELLGALIRGYDRMAEPERLAARLHLAVRLQAQIQAEINYQNDLSEITPEEDVILNGHRNTPPDVTEWNCPVPLLLVDVYYEPLGSLPQPVSGLSNVNEPANLYWMRPTDPYEFLVSLARIGILALHEHVEMAA